MDQVEMEPKKMDRSESGDPIADDVPEVKIGQIPCVAAALSCITLNSLGLGGWLCIGPNEAVTVKHCGVITSLKTEPGCHMVPACGMEERRVSLKQTARDLPQMKVVDTVGSPVMVSAIINYQVVDPLKALYSVESYENNLMVNAQAVLKMVVGQYSYNELKANTEQINASLRTQMDSTIKRTGVHVISMYLNELNYAPEIASAMLKKQQAGALIEARQLIVDGAVRIAGDAIKKITEEGTVKMTDQDKVKIITNLLTVTCSDTDTTPTVSL